MDLNSDVFYDEQTVELQLRKFVCQNAVNGRDLAMNREKCYNQDVIFETLIKYMACDIVKEENIPVYFSYPSTWWQMFKRDVCPFLLKYFPLKEITISKTVHVERGGAYPAMPIPDSGPIIPVKFVTVREEDQ